MRREVADIRTRFAVVGLDGVQAAFRQTADVLGRVTRISRQSGNAAGASGAAAQAAARQAADGARAQVQAAARAAQEQVRVAREAAARQSQIARQQAAERIRLAREAAAQAQRDAAAAAQRAGAAGGPTPGMNPAQAAAARAAQAAARQAAQDAAARARAAAQAYQDELRQARVRQAQADREARRQVQAAQAAARAAQDAARAQARQDAQTSAARIALIRQEAAQRAAQARADAAARAAQNRADAQASRERIRQLRDLARQQGEADRQRQAALRAQVQADEAAARAAVAAARAATGAQRAAARQAARDALERLRQSRDAARLDAEAARRRQADLNRQAEAEARIQRERERRAREQARREQADIRTRSAAEMRAEREAERVRRDAERAAQRASRTDRRAQDDRVQGENRVQSEIRETTGEVDKQEGKVKKLGAAFGAVGGKLKSAVGGLGKLAIGGAVGGAGLAAGAFGLSKKATESASEYARSTYYASLSTGLDSQTFSQLSDAAKKYGLEIDDLRGSLIGFQGVIAESGKAGAGDPIFDALKALDVDIGPVNGKLKTTDELLIPVLKALRTMSQTEKVGLMGKLFGEDDAGKLMPLFDELLDDPKMMEKALARQKLFGNFIGARDLAIAKQYKEAVQDMGDAYHGLSLEIANVVGPDVSRIMAGAAADIGRNRVAVARVFGAAVKTIGSIVGDIFNMTLYGSQYDAYVKNRWLIPTRAAFETLGRVAAATFRFIGEAYQTLMFNDAAVQEFPWLLKLRDGLIKATAWVKTFGSDLFNVATFRDYNVSGQFPWMTTMRDSVVAFVADMKRIWRDLGDVWSGGSTGATGAGQMLAGLLDQFAAAKAKVVEWVDWFKSIWGDVVKVWQAIGVDKPDLTLDNAWIKPYADSFLFLANAFQEGWGWFKAFYEKVFDFVKWATGYNFESIVFFAAFLTFTGTLRVLMPILTGVLSLFTGIAGAAGAASTVTGIGAAIAGLVTSLTTVLPLLAALAGYVGAKLLDKTAVGDWFRDAEWAISGRDNSPELQRLRAQGAPENMTPEERVRQQVRLGQASFSDFGGSAAQRAAEQAQRDWQDKLAREAAAGDPFLAFKGYVPKDYSMQDNAAPRNAITINIPDLGQVQASQTDDQYAQTLRDYRRLGK